MVWGCAFFISSQFLFPWLLWVFPLSLLSLGLSHTLELDSVFSLLLIFFTIPLFGLVISRLHSFFSLVFYYSFAESLFVALWFWLMIMICRLKEEGVHFWGGYFFCMFELIGCIVQRRTMMGAGAGSGLVQLCRAGRRGKSREHFPLLYLAGAAQFFVATIPAPKN